MMFRRESNECINSKAQMRLPNPMHLPWRVTRLLDRRALRQKLQIKSRVGASSSRELERFLVDRAGEARDLFALRGVRTQRSTVFQLMSRSVTDDAAANDNGAFVERSDRAGQARLTPASLVAVLR